MAFASAKPAAHHPTLRVLTHELAILLLGRILGGIGAERARLEVLNASHAQHGAAFDAVQCRGKVFVEKEVFLTLAKDAGAVRVVWRHAV